MRLTLVTILLGVVLFPASAQHWEPCASMPTPRMDAASAVIGDTLYVMGGRQRGGGGAGTGDQGIDDAVEAYVPTSDQWVAGFPNLPMPLADMASTVIGSRIYLFGGTTSENAVTNVVWSWRPGEGAWRVHADTLALRLRGAAATVVDGVSAVIMGGADAAGNYYDSAYRYTPASGFSAEPQLSQARSGAGAGTVFGVVMITGGYFHGPLPSTEILSDRTWVEGPGLPSPRGSALACQDESLLFLLGGQGTSGDLQEVLVLPSFTAGWVSLESMISPRSRLAGGVAEDYLIAAGGTGPVGYEATGSCERALLSILASPGEPVRASDLSLSVWPNPFTNEAEIMADLKAEIPWVISIYSLDGRMVYRTEGNSRLAHVRFHAGAEVPCGLYMVSLSGKERRMSRPLTKVW